MNGPFSFLKAKDGDAIQQAIRQNSWKGVHAQRMATQYDGTPSELKIPEMTIFTKNYLHRHEIPELSIDRIERIFKFNCFGF